MSIDTFTKLHIKGEPLIVYNVWDAGSAVAVSKAGAKAIATGSWRAAMVNVEAAAREAFEL